MIELMGLKGWWVLIGIILSLIIIKLYVMFVVFLVKKIGKLFNINVEKKE